MLTRLAIFGFLIAAVATLFDQGTLWQFTLDPGRRLTMVAYWILHAVLVAVMFQRWRSLRKEMPAYALVLTALGILALAMALTGLLAADVVALIQVIFAEQAFGAFVIIVALLLVRFVWRIFQKGREVASDPETPTWGDGLSVAAIVPLVVVGWFVFILVFVAAWQLAEGLLDYAILGHNPAAVDWWRPVDRIERYLENWQPIAILAVVLVAWILLDTLLARRTRANKTPAD